jgi:hypothetical protein
MVSLNKFNVNPKPQTMRNLLSNKTLQATYGGDAIGGSVVGICGPGNAWGVSVFKEEG